MEDQNSTENPAEIIKETPAEPAPDNSSDTKSIVTILGIIIGLILLSFAGVSFYENITGGNVVDVDKLHQRNLEDQLKDEEGYVYNGFSFVKADGLWWTEFRKTNKLLKIPLHFGPKDLDDIKINGHINPRFNDGEDVYIAINPDIRDPHYSLGISELSFNLVKGFNRNPVGSCTREHFDCEGRTIISCNNTQGKPVVELTLSSEEPLIELSDMCIKISGQGYNLVKAVDRVLFRWYGIMN
jgi:hypothetical protein